MGLDFINKRNNRFQHLENRSREELLDANDLFHRIPHLHRLSLRGRLTGDAERVDSCCSDGTVFHAAKGWAAMGPHAALLGYLNPECQAELNSIIPQYENGGYPILPCRITINNKQLNVELDCGTGSAPRKNDEDYHD